MDLVEYDYGSKPYIVAKVFDVHALSDEGFNQYIGPNSYAHKYLNKITQKTLQSFYKSPTKSLKKNSSFIQSNEINKEENHEENKETLEIKQSPIKNLEANNDIEEEKQANENIEKEQNEIGFKTSNGFFNNLKKSNNFDKEVNNINNPFMSKTTGNFYSCKSNLDLLTRRLNFTSSNFKRTDDPKNNFQRFDRNYVSNLQVISKKDHFKNKNTSEHKYKRRYDGFQSFNVPRVEKINIDGSKPMNKLAQSIAKSCVGNKKVSYENAYSSNKLNEVLEENQKLRKILLKQLNSKFLKSSNLPAIAQVMEQPKLKIKKMIASEKIKFMGGKYNPYNFQAGRDCETMRRNQVGGLFQH